MGLDSASTLPGRHRARRLAADWMTSFYRLAREFGLDPLDTIEAAVHVLVSIVRALRESEGYEEEGALARIETGLQALRDDRCSTPPTTTR